MITYWYHNTYPTTRFARITWKTWQEWKPELQKEYGMLLQCPDATFRIARYGWPFRLGLRLQRMRVQFVIADRRIYIAYFWNRPRYIGLGYHPVIGKW